MVSITSRMAIGANNIAAIFLRHSVLFLPGVYTLQPGFSSVASGPLGAAPTLSKLFGLVCPGGFGIVIIPVMGLLGSHADGICDH